MCTLAGHTGMVITLSFSPDGTRIVSGGEDRAIKLWDAATGGEVMKFVRLSFRGGILF